MDKKLRWYGHSSTDARTWQLDETYIKTNGKWEYLYRAVDTKGNPQDFYLLPSRNKKAAYHFLSKLFNWMKKGSAPKVVASYGRAIMLLKREGKCPTGVEHWQIKYRNNIIECDHGKLKRIINPTLGFKSLKTAHATIKGIEAMRALKKDQADHFYYGHSLGEVRPVNRAFGL